MGASLVILVAACGAPQPKDARYVLVNDTSTTVAVSGCGAPCPIGALQPQGRLGFPLNRGEVTIRRLDGSSACFHMVSGVVISQTLTPVTLDVSAAAGC